MIVTMREALIIQLKLGDDFEITSRGNLGIYRLMGPLSQQENAGKWAVHWTGDGMNKEEMFADVGEAVDRFLQVRSKLNRRRA